MVSIHQSQFLSWTPLYFKILSSDFFVTLDDVQFQKNGVQNRNLIKTPQGTSWITIPVKHDLNTKINQVAIDSNFNCKKLLKTIPFEHFVLKPHKYIEDINYLLKTSSSKHTEKVMKKQRVPRNKISDGIPLQIYKRFGWEPGEKDLNERQELNKRRDYMIKQGISKKYLKILDKLSEDYESFYLNGILK